MPFENKELSRAYKIVFIDCVQPGGPWGAMVRFEVTFPDGRERSIRPIFTNEFVDDYFRIPGDTHMYENRSKILKEEEELFKKWGLVKIEECINNDSLEREPNISRQNFEWAEKIKEGHLQPSSQKQDSNTYIYIPERKVGFK